MSRRARVGAWRGGAHPIGRHGGTSKGTGTRGGPERPSPLRPANHLIAQPSSDLYGVIPPPIVPAGSAPLRSQSASIICPAAEISPPSGVLRTDRAPSVLGLSSLLNATNLGIISLGTSQVTQVVPWGTQGLHRRRVYRVMKKKGSQKKGSRFYLYVSGRGQVKKKPPFSCHGAIKTERPVSQCSGSAAKSLNRKGSCHRGEIYQRYVHVPVCPPTTVLITAAIDSTVSRHRTYTFSGFDPPRGTALYVEY